jgi:hypothetical protein
VTTIVVIQATLIFEVLGSNIKELFFTIKTTNIVSQDDMWAQSDTWIQGDMCAKFKIEFQFEFMQDLE